MPCPHGWCSPAATCETCRKAGKHLKGHEHCAEYAARAKKDSDEMVSFHNAGIPTLWSAITAKHDKAMVHALFILGQGFGTVTGYFIPKAVYNMRTGMRGHPTPADFAAYGNILSAPNDF